MRSKAAIYPPHALEFMDRVASRHSSPGKRRACNGTFTGTPIEPVCRPANSGVIPCGAAAGLPDGEYLSRRLRDGRAETQDRKPEEQGPDHGDRKELRPHHVQSGAAIEDRLRERDEMRRWRRLHDVASQGGMLSSGVLLPESMFMGRKTSMYSSPSCGIDRATVPRKIPIAVAKNR